MSKITYTYSYTKYGGCDEATQCDKFFNSMKAFHAIVMLGGIIGCMVWVSNISQGISSGSDSNILTAPYICSALMSFIVALYESGKERHTLKCCNLYFDYVKKQYPPALYEMLPTIDPNYQTIKNKALHAKSAKTPLFFFFLFACLALFSVVYLFMAKNNGYYHSLYLVAMLVSVLLTIVCGV